MPDKSRSVRHQRIMDLLDNALETSSEVGFMPVGRPDSCIRCGLAVDADTTWCPACHPTNATPGPADTEWPMARWWEVRAPVPSTMTMETVDALMRVAIREMAQTYPSPATRRFASLNQPDDGWVLP